MEITDERNKKLEITSDNWDTIGSPGLLGSKKDSLVDEWNGRYGEGNWRLAWITKDGATRSFEDMFWGVYVLSYVEYFKDHPEEAIEITSKYSYAYDRDPIENKKDAFDLDFLRNKKGKPSQFHHVAMNIALERVIGLEFKGEKPLQVRYGKSGLQDEDRPEGWRWSPWIIPAKDTSLIPDTEVTGRWKRGSIEDLYQKSKVLQVKKK